LTKVCGDFTVEVKVGGTFAPGGPTIATRTAYNGAGLLLMKDEQTYLRLDRAVLVRGWMRQAYANFELRVDGKLDRFGIPADYQIDDSKQVWLRLERRGNEVRAAVAQEADKWHYLPPKTTDLPEELLVGVAAVNASDGEFSPWFEELRIARPMDGEETGIKEEAVESEQPDEVEADPA
jgi:regulation of enolase protein 1 (concanavalin A-like superfamily)